MNILMIDTSGPACGVAIMADGRLVYEAELTHRQTHSQRVMPMVDTALQMSDMTAADMDVFGAVVGPVHRRAHRRFHGEGAGTRGE